jgi:hypothetical protein
MRMLSGTVCMSVVHTAEAYTGPTVPIRDASAIDSTTFNAAEHPTKTAWVRRVSGSLSFMEIGRKIAWDMSRTPKARNVVRPTASECPLTNDANAGPAATIAIHPTAAAAAKPTVASTHVRVVSDAAALRFAKNGQSAVELATSKLYAGA